jgi:hypothetical protein
MQVEEPAVHDFLRSKRDIGRGPVDIDVERDPAGAVAGCQRDRAEHFVGCRRCAGRIDAKTTCRVGTIVAERALAQRGGIGQSTGQTDSRINRDRRAWQRLAVRVDHAADDEHAARCRLQLGIFGLRVLK